MKPAVDDPAVVLKRAVATGKKVVATSYLGHPVGQVHGACAIARVIRDNGARGQVERVHGMLSHHCYEATPYGEGFPSKGPVFLTPEGAGIGFHELLEGENWRAL